MQTEDLKQYEKFLPGLTKDCPDEFVYLAQIFKENVFELMEKIQFVLNKSDERQYYVVYMMNDAIESFLVFENAVMTGEYEKENEEKVQGTLDKINDNYILAVRQGNHNSFTIRFSRLRLENNLYQYHNIGHFWVKKDEYLRQINYRLGILQDKYKFLGEKVCNQEELELLPLYEFAPLRNYICVSWEKDEPFQSTDQGIEAFLRLVKEANDYTMEKWLIRYQKRQSKWNEWMLTKMLKTVSHKRLVDLLIHKIDQASLKYNERSFGEKEDQLIASCRKKLMEILLPHNSITCLEEQPFSVGDEFTYTFHLLNFKENLIFRKIQVHSIVLKGSDLETLESIFDLRLHEYLLLN